MYLKALLSVSWMHSVFLPPPPSPPQPDIDSQPQSGDETDQGVRGPSGVGTSSPARGHRA